MRYVLGVGKGVQDPRVEPGLKFQNTKRGGAGRVYEFSGAGHDDFKIGVNGPSAWPCPFLACPNLSQSESSIHLFSFPFPQSFLLAPLISLNLSSVRHHHHQTSISPPDSLPPS